MKKTEDEKAPIIIIKKIKKGGHAHHGGAWKVAFADFVTAMMAFFLLLWLLNVTTEEQKFAISNYFDPTFPKVSDAQSGAGGVMGGTTVSPDGAMSSTVQPITQPEIPDTSKRGEENVSKTETKAADNQEDAEEEAFKEVEQQIRQSLEANPELRELTNNLIIDVTPEGLRIQIVDQDNSAMFPSGSAQMYDKTRKLLELVAKAVKTMPNQLSVRGHTDSAPYPDGNSYDNWELSADRANASRRALLAGGFDPKRISNVLGKADTDHIDKANPMAPLNRRISLILMRQDVAKSADKAVRVRKSDPPPVPKSNRPAADKPAVPFRSGGGVLTEP
jgi:chemotaxis protein MotB